MALIPAVLAALGCGVLGTVASLSLQKREKLLSAWLLALSRMELTLKSQRLPIHGVLESGVGEHPLIDARLTRAAKTLKDTPSATLLDAWNEAVQAIPCAYEKDEEKTLLEKLFKELGAGMLEKRREAVSQGLIALGAVRQKALEAQEKNGRLYRNLGWLGGLALALLII